MAEEYNNHVPGPGQYKPENSRINEFAGGKFTMGQRTTKKNRASEMPGPANYNVVLKKQGNKFSLRPKVNAVDQTKDLKNFPSPQQYQIKSKTELPMLSFANRMVPKVLETSQGPCSYNTTGYKATGTNCPKITMSPRYKSATDKNVTPAPNSVISSKQDKNARMISMSNRNGSMFSVKNGVPGPGQYQVSPAHHGQKQTFGQKYKRCVSTLFE